VRNRQISAAAAHYSRACKKLPIFAIAARL